MFEGKKGKLPSAMLSPRQQGCTCEEAVTGQSCLLKSSLVSVLFHVSRHYYTLQRMLACCCKLSNFCFMTLVSVSLCLSTSLYNKKDSVDVQVIHICLLILIVRNGVALYYNSGSTNLSSFLYYPIH